MSAGLLLTILKSDYLSTCELRHTFLKIISGRAKHRAHEITRRSPGVRPAVAAQARD